MSGGIVVAGGGRNDVAMFGDGNDVDGGAIVAAYLGW